MKEITFKCVVTAVFIMCFLSNLHAADALLAITPLWNTTDHLCNILEIPKQSGQRDEMASLSGSSTQICSVNVKTSPESYLTLKVADHHRAYGTDFIYVERMGDSPCDFKYAVFKHWTCPVIFHHENLTIHFQADVTLHVNVTTKIVDEEFRCPDWEDLDKAVGTHDKDMSDCYNQVKGYNQIQTCETRDDTLSASSLDWSTETHCVFDIPPNCNSSLGDKNGSMGVTFVCRSIDDTIQRYHNYILFPFDISSLNLADNRITTITKDAFLSIGLLVKSLDLSRNKDIILNPKIFQNLPNLKLLGLTGCNLNEIEGGMFQYLANVTELWLSDNTLSSLDPGIFRGLATLVHVNLNNNKLRTLPFIALKDLNLLEELSVYNNKLTTLGNDTFIGLDALILLDLGFNYITHVERNSFRDLSKLKTLILFANELVSLDVGSFTYLVNVTFIDLSGNCLETLDVSVFNGLNELTTLNLALNRLDTLAAGLFSRLNQLTYLFLSSNRITIPNGNGTFFESSNKLLRLNLYSNSLEFLPEHLFKNVNNLTHLTLSRNRIKELPVRLFNGLKNLRALYLDRNRLVTLHEGLFDGITKLIHLQLFNNGLETIPVRLINTQTNIYYLRLMNNRLKFLDKNIFQGSFDLEYISLHNNTLEVLDVDIFNGLTNLFVILLSGNKFKTLEVGLFSGLTSLTTLHLGRNMLQSLRLGLFSGLITLEKLYLNINALEILHVDIFTHSNMSTMADLNLASNSLTLLQYGIFKGLHSLINLYLNNNKLIFIEPDVFNGLIKLCYLVLNDNHLKRLDFNIFSDQDRLSFLDLSNNALEMIPGLGHMRELTTLYIKGDRLDRVQSIAFEGIPYFTKVFVDQPEICECYLHVNVCTATFPQSEYLTCSRLLTNRSLLICMCSFAFCAITGNVIVLYITKSRKGEQKKVQTLLLGHLAMSDLIMGIYMLIVASADIHYGEFFAMHAETWRTSNTCKLAGALCITSSEASVLIVTLISMDRFIGIKYPYSTHKLGIKSTWITVSCMWIFALTVGIVPSILTGRNPDFYDNSHVCVGLPLVQKSRYGIREHIEMDFDHYGNVVEDVRGSTVLLEENPGLFFSVALFLGFNLVCFLIIFIAYVEIIRAVAKTAKTANRKREMNEEMKLTAKVAVIVATDFFCWFPIIITGILVQTGVVVISPEVFAWAVTFILPINSAINPFLYTIADIVAKHRDTHRSSKTKNTIELQVVSCSNTR